MKMEPKKYTVEQILELRSNKMLTVNAEYQRGRVWTEAQQKRLIDSVLRGYPLPLIYLHHIKTEVAGLRRDDFEIIDGQQRIDALYFFAEGAFRLFDPVKDEARARFPSFLKDIPCPWGGKDYQSLYKVDRERFLGTTLSVVRIDTKESNEARDLFIRLQAGMPLNAQEKRDAWPGSFTDFILRVGGKPEIPRYPGHDFFRLLMGAKAGTGRGKFRQFAAQMIMLFLMRRRTNGERFCTINSIEIDDFYYKHLDFDATCPEATRFLDVLTKLTDLLPDKKRKKLIAHESIHLMLLVDSLMDDYTRSWEGKLAEAFDDFRHRLAVDRKKKDGRFWYRYGVLTRTASAEADTIQRRHYFFCEQMHPLLGLQLRDPKRNFGPLEREIIYYRDKKACQVCNAEVLWSDVDIHHVDAHAHGGPTILGNGVLVHRHCHPKGEAAVKFAKQYRQPNQEGFEAGH